MFGKHENAQKPLPNPYPAGTAVVQDPQALGGGSVFGLAAVAVDEHRRDGEIAKQMPASPASTPDAVHWYQGQHEAGATSWFQLCLSGARIARGLPAVAPRARTAGEVTPERFRVYDPREIQPGMVLYFWGDDDDVNGHIVTGAYDPNDHKGLEIPTWTNDALTHGGMDRVPGAWFPLHWGKPFRFAATSLNGFELDGAWNREPKPKPIDRRPVDLIRDLREAVDAVRAAEHQAKHDGREKLAQVLMEDGDHMARRLARLSGAH